MPEVAIGLTLIIGLPLACWIIPTMWADYKHIWYGTLDPLEKK